MAQLQPVDFDPFAAPQQPQLVPVDHDPFAAPGLAADVGKSARAGAGNLVADTLGAPGDVAGVLNKGVDWLLNKAGVAQTLPPANYNLGTSGQISNAIKQNVGNYEYAPQTALGSLVKTGVEFAPAALGGEAGLIRKGLQVALPAAASEGAGQLTKGTAAEPVARLAGALLSPGIAAAGARAITPFASSPERQRLVQVLNNEGVTSLTAGQQTGNKGLQYAESALGDSLGAGGGASDIQHAGQQQFTEAAMRRTGGGPSATPENLANNNARLGNEFETLSARNTLTPDNQLVNDVTQAVRDYQTVPPSQQRAIVENYVNDIAGHVANGGMPGPQYQEMRSRLSRQSNSLRNSDPTLSDALGNLRDSLDGAMGRSIAPADQQAWQQARQQWGAQKTLEGAASRAGEATAEGQITPANLRNAVSAKNRGQYARGEGDFADLARAGAGVMAPLPNSGTGQRVAVHTMASMLGAALGAPAGGGVGSVGTAALGAAAGPALLGRLLMSRPVQAYLGNQVIGQGRGIDPRMARLLALDQFSNSDSSNRINAPR